MQGLNHEDASDDELIKIAVRLYERDKSNQEQAEAVSSALSELDVPPEYLERAREELITLQRQREVQEKIALARRRAIRNFIAMAIVIVGLFAFSLLAPLLRPNASPQLYNFKDPTKQWSFITSPGTRASAARMRQGGENFGRITVNSFLPKSGIDIGEGFYANLDIPGGAAYLHGLHTLTVTARGHGLNSIRMRFLKYSGGAEEEWLSDALPLTDQWQVFKIPLDHLYHARKDISVFRGLGRDRPDDYIDYLQVQLGKFVNSSDDKGWIDIKDVGLH